MKFFKLHVDHLLAALAVIAFISPVYASTLNIETDYRIRGILYTNNDFDNTTSTDTLAYYSQRLGLTLKGSFNEGIEICSKISAIGIVGSTSTFTGVTNSSNTVVSVPYRSTDFTPFIDYAYVKIKNLSDSPINIIAGKQPLTYGNGLIISDNGTGINAFRIIGEYNLPIPVPNFRFFKKGPLWSIYKQPLKTEIFTAKLADGLRPAYDLDLFGLVNTIKFNKYHIEFSYFQECDGSGTKYIKGPNAYDTTFINKYYYDFYITRNEAISNFRFEIAKQNGSIERSDGEKISTDALGYNIFGELIGEKTKLGKVTAHAQIAFNTGDKNPPMFADDGSFSPSQTRRFDGLERTGYGELFAASPFDSTFPLPSYYSGLDTLNLGVDFSPVYAWNLGLDYFYFSATEGPNGAPEASGFERLYGAEYSLGVEMDIYAKYTYSKYTSARLSYCR